MEVTCRAMTILAIVIHTYHELDAELNVIPSDTEVKIKDSTYMNCSTTSLEAEKIQWRHGNNYVYTGIHFLDPYTDGRFSVEVNSSTGASNLVIRSVQPSDAGTYECLEDEGFGEKRSAQLIVLDDDPICKSNMHSDGVIGPNSCYIEPEEIQFSCSITYHGNIPPVLEWKTGTDNQSVREGLVNVTSSNNEVTSTLTMNSTIALNSSSYVCQTTRSRTKHYSCSSDTVNILYVFSSETTINMTLDDEVSCFANTSQSCSYRWKWFNGDDVTSESDNQILKPKNVGRYRCEATCLFRNRSCAVNVMYTDVYSVTGDKNRLNILMLLLVLVAVSAVIGLGIYMYIRRLRRRRRQHAEEEQRQLQTQLETAGLPEIYTSKLKLVQTIETKEAMKLISGLTLLDKELFVISESCSEVEVFDSTDYSFSRLLNLKDLIDPRNITSCKTNKCLYIFDFKGCNQFNSILRVNPNANLIKKWSTGYDYGYGLSVTNESNVILTILRINKLIEYSPVGEVVREISLYSEDGRPIHCPSHAIKLSNGNYTVCHGGSTEEDVYDVCIVDANGKRQKSYSVNRRSDTRQLKKPSHLAVDENGFVMVADTYNSRILLLDSTLEFKGEILSRDEHDLRRPIRIILDKSDGQLFVVDYAYSLEGRILIFKFCKPI